MAAVDDIYNEITRNSRTRKGRSFFPAANAINSTPQGQPIIPERLRPQPVYDTGTSEFAPVGSGRATAASTRNYLNTYGFDTPGGNVGVYLPSGGFASVRKPSRTFSGGLPAGGTAPYAGESGISYPSANPPTAPAYGSQVGFSMLSNVPSAPSIPTVAARPYEAPPPPLTTPERIGHTAFNVLNYAPTKLAQAGSVAASLGRGIYGLGRDIYGGFTGNRTQQPPPSEMGAGVTPSVNPMIQNPWGKASWNYGLPGRYFDPNYNQ